MVDEKFLRFSHVYTSTVWGGDGIRTRYRREDAPRPCSESWEISAHPSGRSIVRGGKFDGIALDELTARFGAELVGTKAPDAKRFPLLFKVIDAHLPLSVQVHPNESTAPLTGGEPKSEAWYVLGGEPGAMLYAGLSRPADVGTLRAAAQNMIYEVQQSSDTTYRLYDWGRTGADGKPRELHVEKALASLNTKSAPPFVRRGCIETPYFTIRDVRLDRPMRLAADGSSFIAVFVAAGSTSAAAAGESLLVPASGGELFLEPTSPGTHVVVTTLGAS